VPALKSSWHLSKPNQGLTLIEVMVALAVVAVALLSGFKSFGMLAQQSQRQINVFLAQVCADNELNQLRLSGQLPGLGVIEHTCNQMGQVFQVKLQVQGTPNPAFVRVDAQVLQAGNSQMQVSAILSRY
jgi:general secretion pathway protein I